MNALHRCLSVALAAVLLAAVLLAAPALAEAQPTADASADDAFADALALYHDRLYGSAQEAFADFRATFPDNSHTAEALFYEARALLALDRSAAAARRLERLQRDYPAHPLAERAQLRLGRYFFEQGTFEEARRTLRRIVERNAGAARVAEARFLLGVIARRDDRSAEALEQFRAVAEQHPDTPQAPQALYQIASVHLGEGRSPQGDDPQGASAKAADALERLAERYPDAPQAQTLGLALAEVYFDLKRYDQVLSELERRRDALDAEADRARAAFLRAEALRRQPGRLDEAASAYQRYVNRHAGATDTRAARYGLALTHYRQKDFARAADLFARVTEAPDTAGAGHSNMSKKAAFLAAASRAEAGAPDEAADAFAAFLERFPESPRRADALYRRGRALFDAGRPTDAARVLGRLTENAAGFENRAQALYLRSRALTEVDRSTGALESLDAALATGLPSNLQPQALFERAHLLLRAERPAEAADAFAAYRNRFPDRENAGAALFWEAESRYRDGALPQAAAAYQRYLQRRPDGAHAAAAQYGLGWASFQQENYGAAARAFERFLRTSAGSQGSTYHNDALLRLGDSHYARRRFSDAEAAYQRARGEARDYALYQSGQARSRAGDNAAAIDTWRRLADDFPQSDLREEALFQIGQAHFQEQRYERAVSTWRTLLGTNPAATLAARAQYGIGDALYNAGRSAAAERAYRTVLDEYPDSPYASDAAGSIQDALLAQADDTGAEALADSLEATDPEAAAELRFRRAEAQYQRGATDEARRSFQRFVRSSSDENLLPRAYFYLGAIYADAGQYSEAEGYLRQVVRDYPDSERRADAARRLGRLYLKTDRPERALDVYEQMAASGGAEEGNAQARYGQGRALTALGRPDQAEERLRQAIEQAPGGAPVAQDARVALGRLYEEQGRGDEARSLYRRVAEESQIRAGAEALYRLGALLLAEGQPEAAVEELQRLPELFAGYPDWIARSLLAQARAFRRLDRPGQANQLYDRLQNEFAGTDYAKTARREQEAL